MSTLRLIGGQHRGRKLPIPDLEGLRPTSDRIRETVFNWVQFEVPGAQVLDLFAGTGALGLEALSREARTAVFVEPQAQAAAAIKASLNTLNLDGQVQIMTAEQYLRGTPVPYDLIFVDPPFALDLWSTTLERLVDDGWLADGGLVYVETPVNQSIRFPRRLTLKKEKTGGKVCFRLLQLQSDD